MRRLPGTQVTAPCGIGRDLRRIHANPLEHHTDIASKNFCPIRIALQNGINGLASGVLASRPRLSVPITTSGCATATANNGQARAELDGQTVEDLIKLVADGDRAIIDLNSCIDRYNALRETVSGNR